MQRLITRRQAITLTALLPWLLNNGFVSANELPLWQGWQDSVRTAKTLADLLSGLGNLPIATDHRIHLNMDEVVQNGLQVPLWVEVLGVEVSHIVIVALQNPFIFTQGFTFVNQETITVLPFIHTRIRLGSSGDVYALAKIKGETTRWLLAKRSVKVSVGGCGD